MRAFGAIDAKVTSILRSDIYRDIRTPQRPTSHISISSFHHIYPREPEIFIHQGPTSSAQKPFCWDQFEDKQNNYYHSLRDKGKDKDDGGGNGNGNGDEFNGVNSNHNDDNGKGDDDYDANGNSNDNGNGNPQRVKLRGLSSSSSSSQSSLDKSHHDGENEGRSPVRDRHPSIKYSHYGQPNCFDYDWVIVPPVKES